MTDPNRQLEIDVAVTKQAQKDMDRRQETFMAGINTTMENLNHNMAQTSDQIESIHGHITRCRDEMREEIERDFMGKTEGEQIRGSIKEINTKIYMTGLGIVLALSMVQIAVTFYGGS